jgi:N-acetylmuramoyl-L-alanine amidase
MTLKRVAIPSPNYSSRGGAAVTTLVLHTAEGSRTFQSLGSYFANPATQASSHVGIDDTPGTIGEYVRRDQKAWTQANANPWSVAAELCAFAAWDIATWNTHPDMLANAAAWLAEEAAAFAIPLVALAPAQAQNPAARGVCQHIDLGSMGGGHVDCGPAFPFAQVLAMAQGQPITPPTQEEEQEMVMITYAGGGTAMFDGCHKIPITEGQSADAFKAAGIKVVTVSRAQFDRIPWAT